MEVFIFSVLIVVGIMLIMSMIIKPSGENNKAQPGKPTQEEFDKVMKMLMVHGIISNSEYTKMYGRGRAFTKKK